MLKDIGLTVPQGQSLGILGYNGVGKTTLLNLMIGLLRPQQGRCAINAALVPAMRDVFEMTELGNLIDTMTVRDNIRFRAMLFADPKSGHRFDMAALADQPLVKAFELGDQLDKKVSELSSGLRKRAGIVAGMLFDPHVIMLDEPTNSIDPMTRKLLIDYVNELRADGRTLLTVTHDLDYCWKVTDRIIVLDHGRIVEDARVADFADYVSFEHAATLGREDRKVDFGVRKTTQAHAL
ncbi:ATP-binding cassette domain-containing protein [Bifidobacterium stellenboschense]|uniref:Lantibiotic immunity protein n=1 Tax=Bifidobacterium stellenboschense TaxID=762211 RepID=A0A087DTH2_9BIFI|nr:ABC transporter ATP-binding protein [Bifidobacterium stellenboschense]KFI98822.1 lantibiotic immunity protein [Bifidobacterium stellenboschense]